LICKRTGQLNKQGNKSGKIRTDSLDFAVRKVRYLICDDPKHLGLGPGERVALVAAHNAMPYLAYQTPDNYAEEWVRSLERWTMTYRARKKMPKDICIDRVVSFHTDDDVDAVMAMMLVEQTCQTVLGSLESRQSLFVVHVDKSHIHVHFLASTVNDKGKIYNKRTDDLEWNKVLDELEVEHKLTRVIDRGYDDDSIYPRLEPKKKYYRRKAKKAKASKASEKGSARHISSSALERHQLVIDEAIKRANGEFSTFIEHLDSHHMSVIPNITKEEGAVRGVSFYMKGETFKGGDLGRDYQWGQLKKVIGYNDSDHKPIMWFFKQQAHYSEQKDNEICHAPSFTKKTRGTVVNKITVSRRCVLYTKFNRSQKNGKTIFTWKKTGKTAFEEKSYRLSTTQGNNKTITRAMLQRAKELGWEKVNVKGSREFQHLVAMQAKEYGIEVYGFHLGLANNGSRQKSRRIKRKRKDNKPDIPDSTSGNDDDKSEPTKTDFPKSDGAAISELWNQLSKEDLGRVEKIARLKFEGDKEKALMWFLDEKQKIKDRDFTKDDSDNDDLSF
jgi:hypothetical protein